MSKIRLALVIAIIFLFPGLQYAQKIDSMMAIYADNFPQEKAYVQFDKNVYTAGETIWFKSYLFMGIEPSPVSKNFYAELFDGSGNLLQRKIALLYESTATGSFVIPDNFKGNHLHFRAYTTWMLNFDTAFLYEKDIRILNTAKDSAASPAVAEKRFQFFPEGGDLIGGLENNVAFKAADAYGLPFPVKGVLKDASGKDVLEFNSVHDGMGKFLLTPDKGDSFYALWKDDKGVEHRTDLPPVKPDGVALRVMNGNKKVFFSVSRSTENADRYSKLTVIAHMNQQLVYKALVNLKENFMSGGSIPVDQLPSGILQVTIFDSGNLPVAERVVFINNHDFEFSPNLSVALKGVSKRAKNVIEIDVPDTLKSNFSIAVTDAETDGKKTNDDNIISRLLLTGDIRGYVHDPYYYFSQPSDSAAQYLDLVMLTHGWRRFKWDQLAQGKIPVIKYPPQEYLSIKVDVFGVDATRISREESLNVILRKKDSSTQMLDVPRLAANKFGVSGLIFYDTAQAYYQFNVNRKLSSEAAVVFNNGLFNGNKRAKPLITTYTGWSADDSSLLRKNRYVMEESAKLKPLLDKKVQTLEAVTVKGRPKSAAQKLDEEYTSGLFSGGDGYTFDLVNDPISASYMDIFTYLQGKVAGLVINNNGPTPSLQWRGSSPSLYLNEMQVDPGQLKSTPVTDVAMVKVFRPGSGVGFGGGGGGTIAVYTKKGSEKRIDPTIKGLDQARIIGYSPIRQFYSPDYSQLNDQNSTEDIRTTIYWNPYVLTDKSSRKATVQFYNSDITRKLRIVLEGFNANGKLSRVEKIIE